MGREVIQALEVKEIKVNSTLPATGAYTVTNKTADRALNCNANDDLATADVLGTLIDDLKSKGIIE